MDFTPPPSVQRLKCELPIKYVIDRMGLTSADPEKAWCPFHDDRSGETPNLRFYQDSKDGDGHDRFHCDVCGASGDVLNLVRHAEAASWPDTLRIAEDLLDGLPANYERPKLGEAPRRDFDPAAAERRVLAARQNLLDSAGPNGVAAALDLLPPASGAQDLAAADRILAERLLWGIEPDGTLLIPHGTEDRVLTGVKVRYPNSEKGSIPGSKFDSLYGSWLGPKYNERSRPDVLLVEGETDLAFSYLQLVSSSLPLDVLALPRGIHSKTDGMPEWLAARYRRVFLCFDPDAPGVSGTRAWIAAIRGAGAPIEIRVCRLPHKQDLRDSKPSIRHLMATSVSAPEPSDEIRISPGGRGFEYKTSDGFAPLTSWHFKAHAALKPGGSDLPPGWIGEVVSYEPEEEAVMTQRDVSGKRALQKWCEPRNLSTLRVTDSNVVKLGEHLVREGMMLPEVFQTQRVGLHDPPTTYSYAGRTLVTPDGYRGKLPWQLVGFGRPQDVDLDDAEPFDWRLFTAALHVNAPAVTHPILAWMTAAARKLDVRHFPSMFLGHDSGTGKSTTARLFCRMFGSSLELNLKTTTPQPVLLAVNASTTVPVFLDEHSRQVRDIVLERVHSAIHAVYDRNDMVVGSVEAASTGRPITRPVSSPILLAGESRLEQTSEVERIVVIRLMKHDQNPAALQLLQQSPIHRFAGELYDWLLDPHTEVPMIQAVGRNRVEQNLSVLLGGWRTLCAFAEERGGVSLPDEPDFERVVAAQDENLNQYEELIRDSFEENPPGSIEPMVFETEHGDIAIRPQALIDKARRTGFGIPGGSRDLVSYLESHYNQGQPLPRTTGKLTRTRARVIPGFVLDPEEEA